MDEMTHHPAPSRRNSSIPRTTAFCLVALLPTLAAEPRIDQTVGFNRDIRPIMSDTCFRCHGPDKNARMMNLRLDIREEALKQTATGVTPIVPGKPEESAIVARIFSEDPVRLMPPTYSHKELTDEQKETVRRWVAEGAKYEGHWAFQPLTRPAVPDVAASTAPTRNPVDSFVQARLADEGLDPSKEADKTTLIRRLSFDLTGLPPTAAEVKAFLDDSDPRAYEKVVDRLLASPRYAEKQAMHWLDAVRYGDTNGFHGDNPAPTWPYRDYVLRSFRDNKPFDEFTREQLAGDLIPNATTDQKVGSAFNRIHRTSGEGGIQDKEYLAKYGADRVRTTSAVFLGITTGCAECHDHKFDPILTKDFYSMKAVFADLKETGIVRSGGPNAYGTKLELPSDEQSHSLERLGTQLDAVNSEIEAKLKGSDERRREWEKQILAAHKAGDLAWRYQQPLSVSTENGAKLTIYNDEIVESNIYSFDYFGAFSASLVTERRRGDGLVIASGPNPANETYTVTFKPGAGTWTALGIDVMHDEDNRGARVSRGADRFVLTEVEATLSSDGKQNPAPLSFVLATASVLFAEEREHRAFGAIDGDPKTGWGVSRGEGVNPFLAVRFTEPIETQADSVLTIRLRHDSVYRKAVIARFRLALGAAEHSWPEIGLAFDKIRLRPADSDEGSMIRGVENGLPGKVLEALETAEAERDEKQQKAVENHFVWETSEFEALTVRRAKLEAKIGALNKAIPRVVVSQSTHPHVTRILARGNWMDDSGPIVAPAAPEFLGKAGETNGRTTRLDFANWMVSDDNPLTSRVFVNRLWNNLFGTGLSKVLDDLGSQGEWPIYLELLDWLAAEFRDPTWQTDGAHRWNVKHIIRTIVSSHTYRQSSLSTPELDERDGGNRLLARQSRYRVEAENVRDIALAVSGLLVEKFGGPSVRPHQPERYLAAMNFPKRAYSAGRGGDLYRRGLYTHWQRTFLHPGLMLFDAPSREECTVNRSRSNTPLQALVLLNDPVFVEAARVLAQNTLAAAKDFDGRLDRAFWQTVSRPPSAPEREMLRRLYHRGLARFQQDPAAAREFLAAGEAPHPEGFDVAQLAAMTTVARAVLNLHETITRN